jgi:hypothetical protein
MAIFKNKVLAGSQFDGLTDLTGLFDPGNNGHTGAPNIQTRVNSIRFHCDGAAVTFQLRTVDPEDPGNTPLILDEGPLGPTNDWTIEGMILATALGEGKGDSWSLAYSTAGMTGDGWLTVDYDFILTEG